MGAYRILGSILSLVTQKAEDKKTRVYCLPNYRIFEEYFDRLPNKLEQFWFDHSTCNEIKFRIWFFLLHLFPRHFRFKIVPKLLNWTIKH